MEKAKEFPVVTRIVHIRDKKTGVRYLEERTTQYDPIKRWNRVISTRRLGQKIALGSDVVEKCRPKRKASTELKQGDTAIRRRVGATKILDWVGKRSKLDASVRAAYPDGGTADKILSVARFLVVANDSVNNIDSWQYEHDLPYEAGMSEDSCYELFNVLGNDETGNQRLFRTLAAIGGDKQVVLAFDSTTISSYAKGDMTPLARQGFSKEGDGLDTFKLITFYSVTSRLPVSFEMQPGNIPDVSSVLSAIKRAESYGLSRPEVVLDNGFFSKVNVTSFCREHIKFTMRATLTDKWIYRHIDPDSETGRKARENLGKIDAGCPFDLKITACSTSEMTRLTWERRKSRGNKKAGDAESQTFRIYYHYYRNESKAVYEKVAFREKLAALKERLEKGEELTEPADVSMAARCFTVRNVRGGKIHVDYNQENCEKEIRNLGMFVLISNVHKDPWTALKHYRQRNIIEQSYKTIKSELDGRRARVWTPNSERGKELCRLVALGYRFFLQDAIDKAIARAKEKSEDQSISQKLRDNYKKAAGWLEDMTLVKFLRWFDCIEEVVVNNGRARYRWSTESTARDKLVLSLVLTQEEDNPEETNAGEAKENRQSQEQVQTVE